jgi:adenylosuccinate lyase
MENQVKIEEWKEVEKVLVPQIPSTPEFDEIFGLDNTLQRMLDVEAALAMAQAKVGMIPNEAAKEIITKARVKNIDPSLFMEKYNKTMHSVVSMVWSLSAACQKESGEYIHWGATTQDIIDTSRNLLHKQAIKSYLRSLKEILSNLLDLSEKHKNTVMAGRTHAVQAAPTTFGFKVAVWAAEVARHIDRLEECKKRFLVGNITGAVGVYGAMEPMAKHGPKIQEIAISHLGLTPAPICFASSRDNYTEYAENLARIATSIARIGNEVLNLHRTEIAEVLEGIQEGRVGSSTMPHKRNPSKCERLNALSQMARRLSDVCRDGMIIEHERDFGWHTERLALPHLAKIVANMIELFKELIAGLEVKPEKMLSNINELMLSEPLMITLAQKIGRQSAHDLVYDSAMYAYSISTSFKSHVLKNKEIMKHLNKDDVEYAFDPSKHIGAAPEIVTNIVNSLRRKYDYNL